MIIAFALLFFIPVVDLAYGAPIEEALKALRGLPAKERLTRVETEARKEGSVRWASSTKPTYVVDVETSSRDYEKTVKEYNGLLKQ